jgi:prepilin-type processing-associated H-X9-DG protein
MSTQPLSIPLSRPLTGLASFGGTLILMLDGHVLLFDGYILTIQ